MSFKTLSIAFLAIVTLQGCVYRMDIPQGNRITEEKLQQLKLGMTREQVEFLLGTPAIVDPYHPREAHYVNYLFRGKDKTETIKTMVLTYDDKNVLINIDGKL